MLRLVDAGRSTRATTGLPLFRKGGNRENKYIQTKCDERSISSFGANED